jgi:hypothetical protein
MSKVAKVVAAILLAPLAVVVAGIGGCEATKAYYDWRVQTMCEADGGVRIKEKVVISRELLKAMGGEAGGVPVVPLEMLKKVSVPFYLQQEVRQIRDGTPRILRTEYRIVRRSDQQVTGIAVVYSRNGGDFPFTRSEPSYFQCPQSFDLERQQFIVLN